VKQFTCVFKIDANSTNVLLIKANANFNVNQATQQILRYFNWLIRIRAMSKWWQMC
jgi:hypothetical protein